MEQTNLVVSPSGETWDEVTRDTSYIGNLVLQTTTDTESGASAVKVFDEWRGFLTFTSGGRPAMNKDFAIAYDRQICLRSGTYRIYVQTPGLVGTETYFKMNDSGNVIKGLNYDASNDKGTVVASAVIYMNRGDFLQVIGSWNGNVSGNGNQYSNYYIERMD